MISLFYIDNLLTQIKLTTAEKLHWIKVMIILLKKNLMQIENLINN